MQIILGILGLYLFFYIIKVISEMMYEIDYSKSLGVIFGNIILKIFSKDSFLEYNKSLVVFFKDVWETIKGNKH